MVDLRRVLSTDFGQLERPSWTVPPGPLPPAASEFLRGFGYIRNLAGMNSSDWFGGNSSVPAGRVLKFLSGELQSDGARYRCVERAYYASGYSPAGFFQFRFTQKLKNRVYGADVVHSSARALLELRICVNSGGSASGKPIGRSIVSSLPAIREVLLSKTTRRDFGRSVPLELFWAGRPLLVTAFRLEEVLGPSSGRGLLSGRMVLEYDDAWVGHLRIDETDTWVVVGKESIADLDRWVAHLVRLHVERVRFLALARLLSSSFGRYDSELVQMSLSRASRYLNQASAYGHDQSRLSTVLSNDLRVHSSEWDEISEALRTMRPAVAREALLTAIRYIKVEGPLVQIGVRMGDTFKNIGAGAIVINRSLLENAINNLNSSDRSGIADALREIGEAVGRSGSADAVEHFDDLTEELGRVEVKRSRLKSFWEGLVAALPDVARLGESTARIAELVS